MYRKLQQAVLDRIREVLRERYDVSLERIAAEQPPSVSLGEIALPVAFELAKRLRKAPRAIATELAESLQGVEGVSSVEVAGAGYLNVRLDRAAMVKAIAADEHSAVGGPGFRLLEHTSINPNKAAHVGHLRNAILGDTFARMLRPDAYKPGWQIGVQNYIDNTGVQVADVVVALQHLQGKDLQAVHELLLELAARGERVDYYLWDLYARVSQWYDADPAQKEARRAVRLQTLHALEHGEGETAQIADLLATAVLSRHLETMNRLGIEYDFLPRESEILHLHFWERARQIMVQRGVLYQETAGKNAGCWVMRRAGTEAVEEGETDLDAKVIVRSNGTVTYVGKDIAYHLWKFGLLGTDFGYRVFREYPGRTCWISAELGDGEQPHFGHADAIYNFVDSRQNDPQANVREALRGMGYTEAADQYTHVNYAMVALTPRCAEDLGYSLSEEDRAKAYLEVSGRKGFGVKADDLLDRLIAAETAESEKRNPEMSAEECRENGNAIAVGALRYFMLKYTRNTVLAFDFQDALSFEGETGPYVQYAAVRAANILRKAGVAPEEALENLAELPLTGLSGEDEIWSFWLLLSRVTATLEQAIAAAEPAILARYAFQIAQEFSNFYHRNHVVNEADPERKALLLATVAVAQRELTRVLGWLGIAVPLAM
ncbi:arginine--tRNA ligase [Terriglobus aquaticus]|uniref:arginine--tRNA ligase n=1 Tax=Terriglobus aquaticus TaxID=940139 RepID=A0ABW9KJ04_9BACT|nr:arginine--tRNA ligase [Terriglobus aquaticus]